MEKGRIGENEEVAVGSVCFVLDVSSHFRAGGTLQAKRLQLDQKGFAMYLAIDSFFLCSGGVLAEAVVVKCGESLELKLLRKSRVHRIRSEIVLPEGMKSGPLPRTRDLIFWDEGILVANESSSGEGANRVGDIMSVAKVEFPRGSTTPHSLDANGHSIQESHVYFGGEGFVVVNGERHAVQTNDFAVLQSDMVQNFVNESETPFCVYCICHPPFLEASFRRRDANANEPKTSKLPLSVVKGLFSILGSKCAGFPRDAAREIIHFNLRRFMKHQWEMTSDEEITALLQRAEEQLISEQVHQDDVQRESLLRQCMQLGFMDTI